MKASMSGVDYRADLLLEAMRPAVRQIFDEVEELMPGTLPECESMSQKALVAIRRIDHFTLTPEPLAAVVQSLEERMKLNILRNRLEQFMAVWTTVNTMEYPDNHTWFQPKGETNAETENAHGETENA